MKMNERYLLILFSQHALAQISYFFGYKTKTFGTSPVDDRWSCRLGRDDMGGDVFRSVCDIHCLHFGNWVRKINHSCEPNVLFRETAISGKWRVMVEVIEPIKAGEMILTGYGKEYFTEAGMKCLCNTRSCFDRKDN